MERRYTLLNVFTKGTDGGNPLAVMLDVDGLDDAAMQALAGKIGLSETVFVFPPKNPAHTAAIRIFTPASELPFAGHPTIGTAVCLTRERVWQVQGTEYDALAVLEAKGGVLRVAVKPSSGGTAFAEFDAPSLPRECGEVAPVDRLAAALGLAPIEIGFENFKPRCFSAGVPFTFVPIANLEAIGRAHVVEEHWNEAFAASGRAAAYLYCRDTVQHKAAFHARAFVPGMGMPEDPATGSAAVGFTAVIQLFDAPPDGTYNIVIEQGYELDRPSDIYIEFELLNRHLRFVRIGGHVVHVGEQRIET